MSAVAFQVIIRGITENPSITEINVRSGPNTAYGLLFKAAVGMSGLPVLEVRSDEQNANFQGKVYQWLRVAFPNGQAGWVRDDLVDILGDGSRFGYGIVQRPVLGFSVVRDTSIGVLAPGQHIAPVGVPVAQATSPAAPAAVPAMPAVPAAPPAPTPAPVTAVPASQPVAAPAPIPGESVPGGLDRVRRAAFNITAAFEGGGYATYQTYDSGIVSYGRFQFTLAAGSFVTVINRYLERASGSTAEGLRAYLPRFASKDESLRQDATLKALCQQAAADPIMQVVQDEVATEGYWQTVIDLSIAPRNIQTPLGYALLFDMSIQHGRFNHLVPLAEDQLGVPRKSRLGENGTTEQVYITKLAQLRRDNLYMLAQKLNLPGMRPRGDFWVALTNLGDWNLQGDASGNLNVNGKLVQVRSP
ncbi:MAG: chitosanase [Anaerolineae bacterium]|nr:chitosanase [Anaerolineae bacterium]